MLPTIGSTSTAGGTAKVRVVTSCRGCRALRKGCSDDCIIRPCLPWTKNPEAQGHATHFLAKFYGRAGLQNLIAAAPDDEAARTAVFRSLLYEACGRLVNPVHGAVGLLWSHQWHKCVDAVKAVLKGDLDLVVPVDADAELKGNANPVVQASVASEADVAPPPPPPPPHSARPGASAAYDIRHLAKDSDAAVAADLLHFARAGRARTGFKRAGSSSNASKPNKRLKGKQPAAAGLN